MKREQSPVVVVDTCFVIATKPEDERIGFGLHFRNLAEAQYAAAQLRDFGLEVKVYDVTYNSREVDF